MKTSSLPLVSVIVPAREEAADITGCLDAVAAQDYPMDRLEVLVVDAASLDGTAETARRSLARWDFEVAAVLSNDGGTASSNLNVGLARSTGAVVCRVDARTRIEPHYVRTCVNVLAARPEVAVVGGAQVALPRDRTARGIGIARALNNRWSMGGSRYRRAATSGASDTVYLGTFRREQLVEAGGWDERLVSNQDFDLNQRMLSSGLVWFDATLRSGYLPRASWTQLWRQYHRFGRAKVRYWRQAAARPQSRQWVLMLAPPFGAVAVAAALLLSGWPARLAAVGVLAVVAVLIEALGSSGPRGGIGARVLSLVSMGIVAGAWWAGVVREAIRPSREQIGSDLRALPS
jgi:glycosyltransferase involved in cell wall biosynthesis